MPSIVPGSALNIYNNEPGSGRTGFHEIPPNNYEWYSEDEKYKPNVQADGGILSSAPVCSLRLKMNVASTTALVATSG